MAVTKAKPVFKYRQVEQSLRADIASGHWQTGDRLPSEYELAERFQVAYLTVRQAVAVLHDQGMLVRVRGKGTFVAGADTATPLKKTRQPLALLFPPNWQRNDPDYFPDLWQGFQQAAGQQAVCIHYDEAERPGVLEPGACVACVLLEDDQQRLVERLRDRGHHVLAVNHYAGRRSIPSVRIDDAAGVEQAVDHLVALGHRYLGFVRGDVGNLDAADRLQGFRQAITRHGVRSVEIGDGFQEARGYDAAKSLFQRAQVPSALVCASDLSALGAMKAARESGFSLPGSLSIVGFGDFSVSDYIVPRLTTVRQSRIELGQVAAELLTRLANGEAISDVVLNAELILRDSTYPAGQKLGLPRLK